MLFHNNEIIGSIVAVESLPGAWLFVNGYIIPEYRQQGFYTKLWEYRLKDVLTRKPEVIIGFANKISRKLYDKHNFNLLGTYSNALKYELRPKSINGDALVL